MFGSKRASVDDSITRLNLPLADTVFNLLDDDVSDARNSDESKSSPKQSITADYQHLILAMNAWHSRCVKGNMKRIRVESMNGTGKEGCALEVGKTNFESEVLGSKQPVLVVFCAPGAKRAACSSRCSARL